MISKSLYKYLDKSFKYIDEITKLHTYKLCVGKTKSHSFNNRDLHLEKNDENFIFSISTLIKPGVQNGKELKVNRNTEIELKSKPVSLYLKGKNFIINRISFPDFEAEPLEKRMEGQLTSLSTQRGSYYNYQRRYRIIIPLTKEVDLRGDFTGWIYYVDGSNSLKTLMILSISNKNFHFFTHKDANNKCYIIIDSMNSINLHEFMKSVNSILLSYAVLKGEYHGAEAYILTYNSAKFESPSSLMYQSLGGGIYGGFQIHTTNPYWSFNYKGLLKYKKDENGLMTMVGREKLKKYMVEFPHECFSKLCELICTQGGVLRSVILFVSNHKSPLEIKIPTLFVAIENITKILNGNNSIPKIIENPKIESEIKTIIKDALKKIKDIEKNYAPLKSNNEESKLHKANFSRITGKLNNFNTGTNNKKLTEPFDKYGYTLTLEEEELIYKQRNIFLHGSDFISLDDNYEEEFRELFHMSLRLQKLIAILLLKASGFSGYILNNARIYDHMTNKFLKEDIFIKI